MEQNSHKIQETRLLFKNLFKIHWVVIAIFAYSITIALLNYKFVKPMVVNYEKLREKKVKLDNIFFPFTPAQINSTIKHLEKGIKKNNSEKLTFEAQPIETKKFPLVFAELNRIAKKLDITFSVVTPQKQKNLSFKNFDKRIINLVFNSNFPQFLNLLNELEESKYPLFIESYSISKNANNNYTIIMKIFTIMK